MKKPEKNITHCPECGAKLDEPISAEAEIAYYCTGDGRCYCSELQWSTRCPGSCPGCGAVWTEPVKKVDKDRIVEALSESDRWGQEGYPSLQVMVDFFVEVDRRVGLVTLEVERPFLVHFETEEPLTPSLAFRLGMMVARKGKADVEDEQTSFHIMWGVPFTLGEI